MRDGWRYEAPREDWPLAAQRWLDGQLERAVLSRADEVVMVTEPLSEDLRRRRGLHVETITNGFDPDDYDGIGPVDSPADPAKLTLAHTGGLGHKQSLRPLLEALVRISHDEPALHERVELLLAGQRTAEQRALHAEPAFAPFVRYVGFVSRPTALAIQRSADVLVLITSGERRGEATGKLFEYLAARRPILLLGTGNAAADIVIDAGAGIAIPTHDTDVAEAALRRILDGRLPDPPPSSRERYAYPVLAERYEHLIEHVIAAARARPSRRGAGK
jgi:glycosyltransferase involved in cell wall biosynthesis